MPVDLPSHRNGDLTIHTDDDTDDEISNPENIEESVETEESELEKSDEIYDSTGSVLGQNNAENANTDAPTRHRKRRPGRPREPLQIAKGQVKNLGPD